MTKITNKASRFFDYFKFLDEVNAKILEAAGKYGIRNITMLAKAANLPVTTVSFRLRKMRKKGQVLVTVNPNLYKLGLAKAFMVAEAPFGSHEKLFMAIRNTDYWTYIIRCYGKFDGYCAYFAFPANHKKELEDYWRKASHLHIITNSKFFWITNSRTFPPDFSWYNFEERKWIFRWKEWIDEVLNASKELPEILKDPAEYNIAVDKRDLLIIKELEKDESIEFKKLAKIVGITPQSVGVRYRKIVERNLIADHNVDLYPFPLEISDLYAFIIDFSDESSLAQFVNACEKKPFVVSYAKIIGKPSLVINIYILKKEFPQFMNSLSRLCKEGIIRSIFYVTLDPTSYRRQTISYEYFENGVWLYNHKDKVKKLKEIASS